MTKNKNKKQESSNKGISFGSTRPDPYSLKDWEPAGVREFNPSKKKPFTHKQPKFSNKSVDFKPITQVGKKPRKGPLTWTGPDKKRKKGW